MVALPILIVTSYVLYGRVFEGKERRRSIVSSGNTSSAVSNLENLSNASSNSRD